MTDNSTFLRDYARTRRFTLGVPKNFQASADGTKVLFTRSASGTESRSDLWLWDISGDIAGDVAAGTESKLVDAASLLDSGEEELSAQEQANRERRREMSSGIVGYSMDSAGQLAVFSLSGALYRVDIASTEVTKLVDEAVLDPRINPPGTHVAYVQDRALWTMELATGVSRRLAGEDDPDISWGLAEFIAAEEMDRYRGYWWAPDGQSLLACRVDQANVPRWHLGDPVNPASSPPIVAYPVAGAANADVTLAVLGLDGTKVDVRSAGWEYLAAVSWSSKGDPLLTTQSRDQRSLTVYQLDPASGATKILRTETDPHWVDLIPGVPAWTNDGRLVHVGIIGDSYRLMVDGAPVSPPDLQVRSVIQVGSEILFSAYESDPTHIHLFRTDNGTVTKLSTSDGVHIGAGTAELTIMTSRDLSYPGARVSVLREGKPIGELATHSVTPVIQPKPRWMQLGKREIPSALLFPTGYELGSAKLPVLMNPYGGPHHQKVLRNYNGCTLNQWLADQGFAVLVADGRGSPGRGPAWEREIAGNFADITLTDQVDALHAAAAAYPDLDLDKVAIRGWSFGGYLAALAVLRRPDIFHAGIAGAPVTDWALYDTHYTERYLGKPQDNPETYTHNSLLADAHRLEGSLMIVHGMADDNVFAAHSLRLSAALFAAGRPHTFLPLSGAHMTITSEKVTENLVLAEVTWLKRELGVNPS